MYIQFRILYVRQPICNISFSNFLSLFSISETNLKYVASNFFKQMRLKTAFNSTIENYKTFRKNLKF